VSGNKKVVVKCFRRLCLATLLLGCLSLPVNAEEEPSYHQAVDYSSNLEVQQQLIHLAIWNGEVALTAALEAYRLALRELEPNQEQIESANNAIQTANANITELMTELAENQTALDAARRLQEEEIREYGEALGVVQDVLADVDLRHKLVAAKEVLEDIKDAAGNIRFQTVIDKIDAALDLAPVPPEEAQSLNNKAEILRLVANALKQTAALLTGENRRQGRPAL